MLSGRGGLEGRIGIAKFYIPGPGSEYIALYRFPLFTMLSAASRFSGLCNSIIRRDFEKSLKNLGLRKLKGKAPKWSYGIFPRLGIVYLNAIYILKRRKPWGTASHATSLMLEHGGHPTFWHHQIADDFYECRAF